MTQEPDNYTFSDEEQERFWAETRAMIERMEREEARNQEILERLDRRYEQAVRTLRRAGLLSG